MSNHLKSILKVCVFALAIVGVILSCTAPFMVKQNNIKISSVSVSPADDTTAYSFTSSYLPFLVSFYDTDSFNQVSSNLEFTNYECFSFVLSSDGILFNWYNNLTDVEIDEEPLSQLFSFSFNNNWFNSVISYSGVGDFYFFVSARASVGFNFNVVKFTIGTSSGYRDNLDLVSSYIEFVDNNDNTIRILFAFTPTDNFNIYNSMLPRTYYLISSFSDSDYYNSGYNTGYGDGLLVGQNNGYEVGYSSGYSNGYYLGYNDGLYEQDIYTFGNLLTAVVDAPVSVFISMLDFNIMGFNLLNLVVGLLTLAVICLVVKLILGGK